MADQMETKQRMQQKQTEWLLTATKELEKARNKIQSLEEELARAKELVAIMVNTGHNNRQETEPVEVENLQKEAPEKEAERVASTTGKRM